MKHLKLLIVPLVLIYAGVNSQQIEKLKTQFEDYSKHVLQEKVFLHTDRVFYLTGETIWAKLYYRDAAYLQTVNVSKVGYIEIVNNQDKPVIQTKIEISSLGNGNAAIYLPVSISSGNYIIRAYTNWMKNFSSDLYFQQQITIINPFAKLGLKPVSQDPEFDLQLLPEGGYLVSGLESKIGFRLVDKTGAGRNIKCAVINENNDTVATFKPLLKGIGSFKFKPVYGHTYRAVVQAKNAKKIEFAFPEVKKFGFVVQVKDTLTTMVSVAVRATAETPIQNPTVYCVVQNKTKLNHCESQFLVNGEKTFLIDKTKLDEGISHITIFNSELDPVCERLYYKDRKDDFKINIDLSQKQFLSRKKVEVNILPKLNNTSVNNADFSIAVYKVDSTDNTAASIDSYLYLTSELKGKVESPEYYLTKGNDSIRLRAIDNLLLTHGWSRYHWKEVIKPNKFEYLPEIGGHLVSASLTDEITGTEKGGIPAYLSTPGKNSMLYISRSDKKGRLLFETQRFYGSHEIVIQTNTTIDSTAKIRINSPFSEATTPYKPAYFDIPENLKRNIEQRSLHMQVLNIFHEKELEKAIAQTTDSIPFYGKADERYRLDDFTRFATMEEVMREYVPGVMVRKHKGKFHFLTLDDVNKTVFKLDPLILIDGLPVFETDKIMAFDPRKVNTLEVVKKRYYLGSSAFEGVVTYQTYQGDLAGFQPDKRSLILNYEGLQQQREFFSPKYETQEKRNGRIADTRHLLHWSSAIPLTAQGEGHIEFYTSDVLGKYKVVIQGITADGHASNETSTFEVVETLNY